MYRSTTLLVGIALGLLGPGFAAAGTTVFWATNNHSYELIEENLSWTEANAAAEARVRAGQSGYLASITSQEEQDFLYASFSALGIHAMWIGLTADPTYGGGGNIGLDGPGAPYWAWTSAEATSYTNWVTTGNNSIPAPNNSGPGGVGEPYVEFVFTNTDGTPGRWNDLQNVPADGNNRYYLVEYNAAVPEPKSLTLIGVAALTLVVYGFAFRRLTKTVRGP